MTHNDGPTITRRTITGPVIEIGKEYSASDVQSMFRGERENDTQPAPVLWRLDGHCIRVGEHTITLDSPETAQALYDAHMAVIVPIQRAAKEILEKYADSESQMISNRSLDPTKEYTELDAETAVYRTRLGIAAS